MINPFLIGTNLYLRPLDRADAPQFVSWLNDAEVTRYLTFIRPVTLRFEEQYIDRLGASDDIVLGMVLGNGDRLIGSTGLRNIDPPNRRASFGILIGEKAEWGKGYGTE